MTTEAPSPIGLFLRRMRSEAPGAAEVVIFTFNHDLAFFERAALGIVQQTDARITVVADARLARHDLYAVRRAGIAYLPGLAWCPGAFHPKVVVIAGADGATVAVGSGNLTLAGWQGNEELWSVHHADQVNGSPVVARTADWLRELPQVVALTDGVPEALRRTADRLDALAGPDESDDALHLGGDRLVHSLHEPIVDQLPRGPVDRLALYAPFHDPGAHALGALLERFQPAEVVVAVQPTLTRIDGPAVAARLGAGGRLITLDEGRYRHGKLVEWERDGQRWALTGSPNLSRAALLTAVSDGGNVEVGVVSLIESTLLPAGTTGPASEVASLRYLPSDRDSRTSVSILGALRTADGLAITLAQPLTEPATVQVSPVGSAPDGWRPAAAMTTGALRCLVDTDLRGGSRVRLQLDDDRYSTVAFVTDPARVLATSTAAAGHRRSPAPELEDVLSDARAAEQLARILDELRQTAGSLTRAKAPAASPGERSAITAFEADDWEDYLDRCQARVGRQTLAFALGLPLVRSAEETAVLADIDWDEEALDDAQVGALDDEDPEVVDEATAIPTTVVPRLHQASDEARKRYRAVAEKMIRRWHEPDHHERLLALRFVLVLVAGGAWPTSDDSWTDLVLDGVAHLDVDSPATEYEDLAGSLAALALSIVRTTFRPGERSLTYSHFERTVTRVDHLLVAADRRRVAGYAEGLEGRFPAFSDPDIVLDLCDRLVNADPIDDTLDALTELGIVAARNQNVIDLAKPAADPLYLAYVALAQAPSASPLAVRSPGTDGWATVLWRSPDLVVVLPGKNPGTLFTRTYRYRSGDTPAIDIRADAAPNGDRIVDRTRAGQPLPHLAIEILNEVGLTSPEPSLTEP